MVLFWLSSSVCCDRLNPAVRAGNVGDDVFKMRKIRVDYKQNNEDSIIDNCPALPVCISIELADCEESIQDLPIASWGTFVLSEVGGEDELSSSR